MMFDEREVFKGLKAWFSSSVPSSSVSQWVKHGGLRTSEFDDADYVFSSNPAAQDTLRIFESQKYKTEEVTVFNTSLIEATVASGKMYLSGKYTGAYILVHPDYQGEIDTFLGGKRPRYNESDNLRSTPIVNVRTGQNDIVGKEGSFTEAEHELVDKESCDEWEFMDESHLHVTNIRDAKRLDRKPVASSCNKGGIVLSSSLLNSVPDPDHRSAFKPTTEKLSCAMAKSRFLSSMDDGVVHIDDIKLPVNQIDDFVPNCNGCRVFSK